MWKSFCSHLADVCLGDFFLSLSFFPIIFCLCCSSGFSLVVAAQAQGPAGFSGCSAQGLEHRLSSCGAWALLLRGMWDLPVLGRFFTTEPPGKLLPWEISRFGWFFSCHYLPFIYLNENAKNVQYPRQSFCFRLACGILVPWPGIEHVPPAAEVQSLNPWTTREVLFSFT